MHPRGKVKKVVVFPVVAAMLWGASVASADNLAPLTGYATNASGMQVKQWESLSASEQKPYEVTASFVIGSAASVATYPVTQSIGAAALVGGATSAATTAYPQIQSTAAKATYYGTMATTASEVQQGQIARQAFSSAWSSVRSIWKATVNTLTDFFASCYLC